MAGEQGTHNTEISDSDKKLGQIGDMLMDMSKRFDSYEGRMDALEARGDKARKDADGNEIVGQGEPNEPSVDSKARKDAEDKERADKARKDAEDEAEKKRCDAEAEEKERADKARKDADEKEEEERVAADARHDSLAGQVRDLTAKLERLSPRARSDSDRERFASIQEQAEPAFQAFSDRAPAPMDGETPLDYKRRLASRMQKHSPKWGEHRLSSVSDEAFLDTVVGDIYNDSISAARLGAAVQPGELREVVTRSLAGHTRIEFQGDAASWMGDLAGDTMRATGKFLSPV